MKHIVFFDSHCSLCRASVKKILRIDRREIFSFAPLDGKSATSLLRGPLAKLRKQNTLVLIENPHSKRPKTWIYGKAVLRIFWLLGGFWRVIGIMCFVPVVPDLFYRFIAKHRRKIYLREDSFSKRDKRRFLP